MYSLLKMGIFHCHVRLPECIYYRYSLRPKENLHPCNSLKKVTVSPCSVPDNIAEWKGTDIQRRHVDQGWWFLLLYIGKYKGQFETQLVGGFNPPEKYESQWESSPNRGENKKYLKPPPTQ